MKDPRDRPLVVVVGSGGVGKTTLAAALGLDAAARGHDTLVMTFDPSRRLKDSLGVGDAAADTEIEVGADLAGRLHASLLDARSTFDRLIERYAPDPAARDRILANRFYDHLSGNLAGVLEYMASERLFEAARAGRHQRIILDTPPTRQALDFLGAPERIVGFLDSGALRIALKPWFDPEGQLKATSRLGVIGKNVEAFFDRMVGLELLRDMAEFFQAFGPLFDGFRERALEVQRLLRSDDTIFVLVSGPGRQRVADTLFFARRLVEAGYLLGPVIMNRVHPRFGDSPPEGWTASAAARDGRTLLGWLGERDRRGVEELRSLLGEQQPFIELPLLPEDPTDLEALQLMGRDMSELLDKAADDESRSR
jgi:anion-transporting  ArsA/GET3 family ATPase